MNYRQFFNMEPVIIGMDILMPFVSFVVERSEINASAAIMYLKAVIGCNGAGYN